MRQQAVPRGQIDNATTSQPAADAPRHLPRLVELLARQAARFAHHARNAIEERVPGKPAQVADGEPALGGEGERHVPDTMPFNSTTLARANSRCNSASSR